MRLWNRAEYGQNRKEIGTSRIHVGVGIGSNGSTNILSSISPQHTSFPKTKELVQFQLDPLKTIQEQKWASKRNVYSTPVWFPAACR